MKIIAKSRAIEKPLLAKANICKNIEIQLFDDFVSGKSPKELYNIIIAQKPADIICVHAPILENLDVNIEFIDSPFYKEQIDSSFKLAELLGEYYDHDVKVIIHSGLIAEDYEKFPSLMKKILSFFKSALVKYPRVLFCFENIIPFAIRNDKIVSRNGYLYDNIDLVKMLRKELASDRFYTVLDTCHAMLAVKTFTMLFHKHYEDRIADLSVESYFRKNADVVGLIHLADVKHLGYNRHEHGIVFKKKRLYKMHQLIDLYFKYSMDCDITIEIQEDDYVENDNFRKNYKDLIDYLNKEYPFCDKEV